MTGTSDLDVTILERRFDAPAELIWQLWTDPSHFAAWYGPDGATIQVDTMDVRAGGVRHVAMEMQAPNGTMRMWFVGKYLEVVPHERLVYTEALSDEHGNVLTPDAAGMPPGHPTVTEVRVVLDERDGITTMTLTHAGISGDSPGAAGWAMALDRFATLVEEHTAG
jgi:uncharacterized protein YndB with AHSA1/START domain